MDNPPFLMGELTISMAILNIMDSRGSSRNLQRQIGSAAQPETLMVLISSEWM